MSYPGSLPPPSVSEAFLDRGDAAIDGLPFTREFTQLDASCRLTHMPLSFSISPKTTFLPPLPPGSGQNGSLLSSSSSAPLHPSSGSTLTQSTLTAPGSAEVGGQTGRGKARGRGRGRGRGRARGSKRNWSRPARGDEDDDEEDNGGPEGEEDNADIGDGSSSLVTIRRRAKPPDSTPAGVGVAAGSPATDAAGQLGGQESQQPELTTKSGRRVQKPNTFVPSSAPACESDTRDHEGSKSGSAEMILEQGLGQRRRSHYFWHRIAPRLTTQAQARHLPVRTKRPHPMRNPASIRPPLLNRYIQPVSVVARITRTQGMSSSCAISATPHTTRPATAHGYRTQYSTTQIASGIA